MSTSSVSPDLKPIWTPEDYQRAVAVAQAALSAEKTEFDADVAYLRSLADAIFGHAPAEALTRIATKDGLA